ncbi:MAG: VCBS repeat-containing protein [Planctomycetota bacterium]
MSMRKQQAFTAGTLALVSLAMGLGHVSPALAQCDLFYLDPLRTTSLLDVGESAAADFDGDGRLDLVLVKRTGLGVFVHWGLGDGTFEPLQQAFASSSGTVAVGDFDEDGRPDIVVREFNAPPSVRILASRPGRTFALMPNAPFPGAVNLIDLAVGDINADGHLDVAAISRTSPAIHIAFGDGTGALAPQTATLLAFGAQEVSQAIAIADLDGNGQGEVVAVGSTGSNGGTSRVFSLRWIQSGSPLDPTSRQDLAFQIDDICTADVDADDRMDVVATHALGASRGVAVFMGDSNAAIEPPVLYPGGSGMGLAIAAADMDGDSHTDILCTNPGFRTFLGNAGGTLTFDGVSFFDVGPTAISVGDFNRDGRLDVATNSDGIGSSTTDIMLNVGPLTWIQPTQDPIFTCPGAIFDVSINTSDANGEAPISWQTLVNNDWQTIVDSESFHNTQGEIFAGARNATTTSMRVYVAGSCCVASLQAVVRCVITTPCGTTYGPPIRLIICRADFDCDGTVDFFDYDSFVIAFESGDSAADFDKDGTVDFFDYDAFVVQFEQGCETL